MPETQRRPRRRINPDKAPYDRLPLIKADGPNGPIRVTRGQFDLEELTDDQRADVQLMHTHEHVVFTNNINQHQLARRGQLIDRDVDLSKFGTLPLTDEAAHLLGYRVEPGPLEELVDLLRQRAQTITTLADFYQHLIDDHWKANVDPDTQAYGDIVDTYAGDESSDSGPTEG